MDQVYNILSKEINIDRDRQKYTELYDYVKKTIVDGLKKNENFSILFCYEKLCGSYADNLKISKPNEFDLVLRLKLPEMDLIKIDPDNDNKGHILIDLTDVLKHLQGNNEKKYNFLKKLTNNQGLLLENKFQHWLESCMVKFLNEIDRKIIYKNDEYKLIYKKEGPAHTIYVQNLKEEKPLFSIDFVPGFLFEANKSVSLRRPTAEFWEAIPRPIKCVIHKDNPSFRTSYTDSEREILIGKNQLKNALRLVKKFRDLRPKMQHLKSYYIKTIFLWLDEEVENTFWGEPICKIMRVVFKKLEDTLLAEEIKFFWNTELNMLQNVKRTQIVEMYREVARASKTLLEPKGEKDILNLFLSAEEQTI